MENEVNTIKKEDTSVVVIEPENKEKILSEEREREKSKSIGQKYKDFFLYQILIPLALLAVAAAFLGVGWFVCPVCIVCVFLFSACTCAYMPVMNIPLWISIIILIWQGWTVTNGALSVTWK